MPPPTRVQIRYRVRPEQVERNLALLRAVFAELEATRPPGLSYASHRLDDGVTFVDHVIVEGSGRLSGLGSWAPFRATLPERCDEPPVLEELDLVATYPAAPAGLGPAVPALPVRDVEAAAAWYAARLRFAGRYVSPGYAVLVRDGAEVHLWGASDERWRERAAPAGSPVCSGAESFLAGTASCRIPVADVDALFAELRAAGVLHPTTADGPVATDFGTREVAVLDHDGNQLTFFRRDNG